MTVDLARRSKLACRGRTTVRGVFVALFEEERRKRRSRFRDPGRRPARDAHGDRGALCGAANRTPGAFRDTGGPKIDGLGLHALSAAEIPRSRLDIARWPPIWRGHALRCEPAVVHREAVSLGGSLGREEATGRGVMYVMQEYSRDFGFRSQGWTRRHPGLRNVGSHLARLLHSEAGALVIAVSDVSGGIYNDKGWIFPACWRTPRRASRFPSGRTASALQMKSSGLFPASGWCLRHWAV